MILFCSVLIDDRVVDRKVPIKFDHFTSLSRRERERNVSKWKNARAGRAELLFLFIKPIVMWSSRSRRRRPCSSFLSVINVLANIVKIVDSCIIGEQKQLTACY